MLGVQIVHLAVLAVIRPFDRLENNLIELVNEVIYTPMLSIMIACNREEEWSGSITSIFCGIILFNSLIITFIMIYKSSCLFIGALLVSLCKKCFRKVQLKLQCSQCKISQCTLETQEPLTE
ncbi:unnamed protein product [Moneuplotes crassus]|uniref:Uncharacterized protein n=1 Tax=Euplotes crassus TaxID=5936 RepID=A0AAD2D7K6_EUPCR|nr:unnamed protein product [Moneuplotes crassus]